MSTKSRQGLSLKVIPALNGILDHHFDGPLFRDLNQTCQANLEIDCA